MPTKEYILKNQNDIEALAREIRDEVFVIGTEQKVAGQDNSVVITLQGDLGAGKTTFTKAFAETLGIVESITSPTFVILKNYSLPSPHSEYFKNLIHIDAYRLQNVDELKKLNFEQYLKGNIICIEWPEIITDILPEKHIAISFEHFPLPEHSDWRKVTVESKM